MKIEQKNQKNEEENCGELCKIKIESLTGGRNASDRRYIGI